MKLLKNYGLSPFAIELYANQKKDLTDYFGKTHKGLTKYQLFLNPDSSVILICNYQEDGTESFYLESSKEYDFILRDFC
jgi:hypothetical protein